MPYPDQGESNIENTRAVAPVNISADDNAREKLHFGSVVGGSYRLKSILGRGGMGVVYLAEHLLIKRDYAIKTLAPDRLNEENWNRFQSEGKAIAKLEHRNLVKIYDMGIAFGEVPFYVMDLLEGPSLAEFIRTNGPLTVDQAVVIFSQISAGLGYAHQCGIIHRDVKPSNIILTGLSRPQAGSPATAPHGYQGSALVVKIVDFGLAKLVGAMAQLSQSQTATGEVFGSPYYMSPEQCLGGKIDERSDVYSLGCTLFECLTGRHPFSGENALETVLMHQNKKPPTLAAVRPDLEFSPACEQLVALMLKKRPPERPQTMAAVERDLERIQEGKSVKPRAIFADAPLYEIDEEEKTASKKANKIFIGFVCALFGVVIAGTIYATNPLRQEPTKSTARLEVPIEETSDVIGARAVFSKCVKISQGVGKTEATRVFSFPAISLGELGAGDPIVQRQEAQGIKEVLPDQSVTLTVDPPVRGKYTIMFPSILAKIGNEDINKLVIDQHLDMAKVPELGPQFFQAISKWSALHALEIHNFKLSEAATLTFNNINPVQKLNLKNSLVDSKDLAQVRWLQHLVSLDVKGMPDVDPVLHALRASSTLQVLHADETAPSLESLEGLATCSRLKNISMSDCGIDDKKLEAICNFPAVKVLVLNDDEITGQSLKHLLKLKRLESVSLKHTQVSQAEIADLKRQLPHCTIEGPL